jgi:hypothetical protein
MILNGYLSSPIKRKEKETHVSVLIINCYFHPIKKRRTTVRLCNYQLLILNSYFLTNLRVATTVPFLRTCTK